MFDYAYYSHLRQAVIFVSHNRQEALPCPSMKKWMEEEALREGSTLQGRKDAYRIIMKQTKYIPVLLGRNPKRILIPDGPIHHDHTKWILLQAVASTEKSGSHLKIRFKDGLECEFPHASRLHRLLNKSLLYAELIY